MLLHPQVETTLKQSAEFIFAPTNEFEYEQLVQLLDEISDIVRDDETHSLAKTMEVIGILVSEYEDAIDVEPIGNAISVLRHFMDEQGLKQKDLTELGSQGVVSQILNGKRELNLRQIKALSQRFKVDPTVFM